MPLPGKARYLNRDEGEPSYQEDDSWKAGDEPFTPTVDTWARGFLPLSSTPIEPKIGTHASAPASRNGKRPQRTDRPVSEGSTRSVRAVAEIETSRKHSAETISIPAAAAAVQPHSPASPGPAHEPAKTLTAPAPSSVKPAPTQQSPVRRAPKPKAMPRLIIAWCPRLLPVALLRPC